MGGHPLRLRCRRDVGGETGLGLESAVVAPSLVSFPMLLLLGTGVARRRAKLPRRYRRAYLAVEQARYGDDLAVEFDLPLTHFRMPPLTLQPIAENAVMHGMDLDRGPLHVWVRTKETGSSVEVVVEDDGAVARITIP